MRLNPYFGWFQWFVLLIFMPVKVWIKSCKFARDVFHMCMDVTTQLELHLHEPTQIVVNTACRVSNQQFLS